MEGRWKPLTLNETAGVLGIDPVQFMEKLKRDGFIIGNTQSGYARRLKLFRVEQGAVRPRGGLYHRTGFRVMVMPNGLKLFRKLYEERSEKECDRQVQCLANS